jgi:hypothetical protein
LLFPSPPHVQSRPRTNVRGSLRQLATGGSKLSL